MIRERAQKAVLVIVGLLFVATVYPLLFLLRNDETLQMMLSLYVTLGVFLLLASRNPSAHRSLIAFAAWSSFAHAGVMAVQAVGDVSERVHLLIGVALFAVIGLLLVAFAPAKTTVVAATVAAS
jgi:drug/metabolite transporter superfamily protein YnfA